MKTKCPTSHCLELNKFPKYGHYFRKGDGQRVQRYRCLKCDKIFSEATGTPELRQRKRYINTPLAKLLCSNVSQNRAAIILGVNPKTIASRLPYLAEQTSKIGRRHLESLGRTIDSVQFDDLITKENSKCKPVSVCLAVEKKTRLILALNVGTIPAFGHLSKISKEKYGPRKNEHPQIIKKTLQEIKSLVLEHAHFESDEHKNYPPALNKVFPKSRHTQYPGGRSCIAGQGELKKKYFDPLFALNHSCAMLRANVNRLIRKSWCTTKKISLLFMHLKIYQWFHNCIILGLKPTLKWSSLKDFNMSGRREYKF